MTWACSQYTAAMSPIDVAAEVTSNQPLSPDYNVVALAAPAIAAATAPGQFVMVKTGTGHDPLLRRPFSVFEVLRDSRGAPKGISILNKRIGASTARLYTVRPGQRIVCLGPLGRPFTPVEPPIDAWMVAGGVGLAPFATLAQTLGACGVRSILFYGARRAEELFYMDFFRSLGVELVLTTEDGTAGEHGRIVAPLERALASRPAGAPVMIYACGPEGMLAATARMAAKHGRPCQVSVERIMGCGLGGCYSCVVPMRDERGGVHHVRSCIAGPVLPGDQILWE
ncbi:MAG: dihydroorotate dehydrogenase electron transfer subunit [Acidobacteria bacterium]|nr:MAG: dihydroorotate dehydrogenase electron transfer subunit [Acidobacteriota bacterium]